MVRKLVIVMDEYIDKLMMCGWSYEQALYMVNDFFRNLDFDGLNEFIRLEECGLCM